MDLEQLHKLLRDRRDSELEHQKKNSTKEDIGFNAFALMSDLYYRENFHSDMLRAILDINEKHGAGNIYLSIFISLLNKNFEKINSNSRIPIEKYTNKVVVVSEEGKIDITIYGEDKHVIIIENKINNAGDTHNQIPRYVKFQHEKGNEIDAIVYLTLNQYKEPNRSTWIKDDNLDSIIKEKLISIRTFTGDDNDLCSGFIEKCIAVSNNLDALSILRQYLKILKHLTRNMIDHNHLTELMKYLKAHPENQQVVISLKKSVEELPWHILTEIFNHFNKDDKSSPFQQIACWKDSLYYLHNYKSNRYSFNTDIIITDLSELKFDFSVRQPIDFQKEPAEAILKAIGYENQFTWNGARFEYKVPGEFVDFESNGIKFIEGFLKSLKENEEVIEKALSQLSID